MGIDRHALLTLPLYGIFVGHPVSLWGYREAIRDVEKSHRASVTACIELTTQTNSRSIAK